MKKYNRVKKQYEFDDVIKNGNQIKNEYYILYYKENDLGKYRFGLSVGKKLGNAVFRNLYKRKIRNIIDNSKKCYQNNLDYIIIMRKACINLSFAEMENKLVALLKKVN